MVVDICNAKNSNGKCFGDILVNDLTPPLIKKYLMTIASESSRKKRHNLITMAWNACINDAPGMPENQSTRVKIVYHATPLGRYVSDEAYWFVYNQFPPYWQAIMELSYILRSRVGELATICMEDILDDGLYYERSKGSNPEITLWTDRLRKAVDILIAHRPAKTDSPYLVFNARKKRPPKDERDEGRKNAALSKQLSNGFSERMRKNRDSGKIPAEHFFTLHDLKAKGISDHDKKHSGHRTITAKKRYIRNVDKVKGTR